MSDVDRAFKFIDDSLYEVTVNAFGEQAQTFAKSAQTVASDLTQNFFTLFATKNKYFDVESSPFGDQWDNLNIKWLKRKDKVLGRGTGQRFYFGIGRGGHLATFIAKQSAEKRFGKSKTRVFTDGRINTSGSRPRIAKGNKGAGQYADFSQVFATVEIDMFSKVRGEDMEEVRRRLGTSKWATKLIANDQGYGRVPERPLFTRYFEWYISNYVPQEIKRRLLK